MEMEITFYSNKLSFFSSKKKTPFILQTER